MLGIKRKLQILSRLISANITATRFDAKHQGWDFVSANSTDWIVGYDRGMTSVEVGLYIALQFIQDN